MVATDDLKRVVEISVEISFVAHDSADLAAKGLFLFKMDELSGSDRGMANRFDFLNSDEEFLDRIEKVLATGA